MAPKSQDASTGLKAALPSISSFSAFVSKKGLSNVNLRFTIALMIRTYRHKGLRLSFENEDSSKLPQDMLKRIDLILSTLDAAQQIESMDVHTFKLHQLKGELKGFYAVTVRANWRIIFRFKDGDAFDLDFVDYH